MTNEHTGAPRRDRGDQAAQGALLPLHGHKGLGRLCRRVRVGRGDGHVARAGDEGVTRGASEIAAFVERMVGGVETVHHGHMPEIEVTSPSGARGTWAMEDKLRWPAGAPIRSLHGYGHYHETYEKVDGRWRIKTITLTRLRLDTETASP